MSGIFPETVAGGLPIRNPDGSPTNNPDVHNAYVPAPGYVSDCELTALPTDCTARIEARQINAIVSELLSLAECLDADGPWQCYSPNNLCTSFNVWETNYTVEIKAYVDASIADAIAASEAADEGKFVNVAGDTMTGDLAMTKTAPRINLDAFGTTDAVIASKHDSV